MCFLWFCFAVLTVSSVCGAPTPRSTSNTPNPTLRKDTVSPSSTPRSVSTIQTPTPRRSNYSVTILNDSSLGDFTGTVHTWLSMRAPGKNTTYFSFSHAKGATFKVYPGISSVDKWLQKRKPSETHRIPISERQYDQLIQAIDDFYKSTPNYALFPEGRPNSYNCVTATNKILNAAGIHILDGYLEPVFLGLRLATFRSVLDKCLFRPNIFMFFGFAFHKTLCLFL